MKKFAAQLLWLALALLGAGACVTLARHRGDYLNSIYILIAALCTYAIGYRFYSKRIAVRFFLLLFLAAHIGHAADEPRLLSHEALTSFEWFSSLDFPDVKGCPFGSVTTGSWHQTGNLPPQNRHINAFLLSGNATQFTTLGLDLFNRTLIKNTGAAPEHQRVGFSKLELKSEAAAFLQHVSELKKDEDLFDPLEERVTTRVYAFVFAWGCWRNGLDSEAEQLYRLSKRLRYGIEQVDEEKYQAVLEHEIGYAAMWRAVIDFGNTTITRPQLLAEFQAIASKYPHSGQQERAEQTAAMLQKMIAEDESHARTARTNIAQLSIEGRVRELIFQLRDQHGEQGSQPGWCDVFFNYERTTNTPAHQLVSIGYSAVPKLIAALEDQMFTRSVGYWRDFMFSHNVLTVGDCAVEILGQITGKYFYTPTHSAGYMSTDKKISETHKLADAWWAEFQKKGEKQMLIEGVATGDASAISQANILIARYPDAAASALTKGIRATSNLGIRAKLIELLEKFNSSEALAFLEREIHEGNDASRAIAAGILFQKGRTTALKDAICEWQTSPDYRLENDQGLTGLARFLAGVDSPDAIAALGRNLQTRPLNTRMAIVHAVGEGGTLYGEIRPIAERSTPTSDTIETFLITSLEDAGQQPGDSGPRLGRHYRDQRICDMAAYYLNQLWPERYHFDLSGTLEPRDRQRAECQNVWTQTHIPK